MKLIFFLLFCVFSAEFAFAQYTLQDIAPVGVEVEDKTLTEIETDETADILKTAFERVIQEYLTDLSDETSLVSQTLGHVATNSGRRILEKPRICVHLVSEEEINIPVLYTLPTLGEDDEMYLIKIPKTYCLHKNSEIACRYLAAHMIAHLLSATKGTHGDKRGGRILVTSQISEEERNVEYLVYAVSGMRTYQKIMEVQYDWYHEEETVNLRQGEHVMTLGEFKSYQLSHIGVSF